MSLDGLDQQLTLEPEPDDPADARVLAGNRLVLQPVRVHEVLGYLKMHLEGTHPEARLGERDHP
ncbi:MAG: hypothetical protein OXL97_09285 [Chloroflexota bacterium]|nr:hypothetical protein [Chloroflexota bacterium]MDE2885019.1 hypothetical protein [Chloroflexota bacterium]